MRRESGTEELVEHLCEKLKVQFPTHTLNSPVTWPSPFPMPTLPLEAGSLAPLNLIILENQFRKTQDRFREPILKFCSPETISGTKLCIIQGLAREA